MSQETNLPKYFPNLGCIYLTDNSKIKEEYLDKFVSNSLIEVEHKSDENIKYSISSDIEEFAYYIDFVKQYSFQGAIEGVHFYEKIIQNQENS